MDEITQLKRKKRKADKLISEKEMEIICARQELKEEQTNLNTSEQKILMLQSKVFFLLSLKHSKHLFGLTPHVYLGRNI